MPDSTRLIAICCATIQIFLFTDIQACHASAMYLPCVKGVLS